MKQMMCQKSLYLQNKNYTQTIPSKWKCVLQVLEINSKGIPHYQSHYFAIQTLSSRTEVVCKQPGINLNAQFEIYVVYAMVLPLADCWLVAQEN